jgi:DNA-binding winged helix-turn-helix (wHTH) protein/Tol biopolymer transport system component
VTERKCCIFNFADVEVREREFLLIKGGERLSVEPKAFRVLLYLLRNPGRLIDKDEIVASVWNDTAVSDNSLTRSIAQLRRVLDDDPREPLYILTVPTLGYRFLCEVAVREEGFGSSSAAGSAPLNGGAEPDASSRTTAAADHPNQPEFETPLDLRSGSMERDSRGTVRKRTFRFASLAAAIFLLLAGGYILKRLVGTNTVPARGLQRLSIERRLTASPSDVPVRNAVVSPDGKYVAYADPTGLYLRQIATGETRPWSLPKGFVAWPASWFPDGTHLLVVRIAGQPRGFSLGNPSLYKLSILGGEPQEVMNDVWAGSVSPDGSRIAYLPMPNRSELWIMDSNGANPRMVISTGEAKKYGVYPSWITQVAWSPSGQHLAYIESHSVDAPGPVGPIRSLRMIGPDGEGASVALSDPRIGEAVWWALDGRIFFSYREDPASRQNNYGVYSLRVDERTGKATSPPQPITQAEGSISGMSGTADGKRLVLWRSKAASQVFIASLDPASHQWKEPRRLTLDANENIADAWTADSKAVLFVSNRNGAWKLFKQAIEETTPEELAEGPSIVTPRLSADGSQVLYLYSSNPEDLSFPASLMSKPLAGGVPRAVIQGKGIVNHQCAKAPSTLCIFSQLDGRDTVFRSFDLEHGAGREVTRLTSSFGNWSLSSDGSKLAIFLDQQDQNQIRFVSLGTGAIHDVTVKDWHVYSGDWATNNQTLLIPSHAPNGRPVILEVDQTGKPRVALWGSESIEFGFMIQSPDARLALLAEFIPSDSNAWIVDDF